MSGARVLRVGENGVVVLPAAGLLAKVVPGADQHDAVTRELSVAAWLSTAQVPVASPRYERPLIVDDFIVSLWEYLSGAASADLVTLAGCLRRLHNVPQPASGLLRPVDPFSRFAQRLAPAAALTSEDRRFLTEYRDDLAKQWDDVVFDLPAAVIHGDAHMDNLLVTPGGRAAFVDLENVSVGPPEWDLTLTALYRECGWFTAGEYEQFITAYGFDVRAANTWPVLRGIRMLRMTLWLAQSAADHPERQCQLRHRISSLRDDSAPNGWTGY